MEFQSGIKYLVTICKLSGCLFTLYIFYKLLTPMSNLLATNIAPQLTNSYLQRTYISSYMASKSRLGNHIFSFASLLGISKMIGRTPVIYIKNVDYLNLVKETNRTIPGLVDQFVIKYEDMPKSVEITSFDTRCCIYQDPAVLKSIDHELIILSGVFYQSHKYFPGMRDKMRSYLISPKNDFKNLPKSSNSSFINCVHVRRGDFLVYDFHVASEDFIRKAVRLIQKEVSTEGKQVYNVLFGDDLSFMENFMNNETKNEESTKVIFHHISRNSPSDDLLYSKHNCDSVFISAPHSTFGWWMGYFSKGDKVFYTDIRATNDSVYIKGNLNPVDYFLPHWTPLRYDNLYDLNVVKSKK